MIARMHSDFPDKFGIPRQSGLVKGLKSRIVFEKPYRNADALRGLSGYSHIWLIWEFSEAKREGWSATVRPPRLGGNERMGVFATRSPFRPNPLGLSSVKLEAIEYTKKEGPVLIVSGADLMDGTPIYDIKPYLPLSDIHTEASSGFAKETAEYHVEVEIPKELQMVFPPEKMEVLREVLALDPRPSYQEDPDRVYGMPFAGHDVRFRVREGILRVTEIKRLEM